MSSIAQIAAFGGVVVLGAMSPGPDLAVVVRRAAVSGRRHGIATAAGVAAGVFVWLAVAATGVAALLATSATAFSVVKVLGAAYLGYLAVKSFRSALRSGGPAVQEPSGPRPRSWRACVAEGFLTNLLNPKAGLFFIALVPQFLGASPGPAETVPLAVLAAVASGSWFVVVATAVSALRRLFAAPRVRSALDAMTGTALLALGLKLVTTQRP